MPPLRALTAGEISEKLSFREFQRLCSYFDFAQAVKQRKTLIQYRHGDGSNFQAVAPRIMPVKFDIFKIERAYCRLSIDAQGEYDKEPRRLALTNVIEMPKWRELERKGKGKEKSA